MKKYRRRNEPFQKSFVYKGEERKSKNWTIRYRVNGKSREETFPTKKLAEDRLYKVRIEMKEGRYFDIRKRKKILFEDLAVEYKERIENDEKRGRNSTKYFIDNLLKEFRGKYIDEITIKMVESYKDKRANEISQVSKQKVKKGTVNHDLSCLRTMLNKAKAWGYYIKENPISKGGVELYKPSKHRSKKLSKYQIGRLIECCSESVRPVVTIALNTGMRRGEILNLKWRNIQTIPSKDKVDNLILKTNIHVEESKNGEERYIPISPSLTNMFETIKINKSVQEDDFVFEIKDLRKSFKKALRDAELIDKDIHFHDLRHIFATQYAQTPGARLRDLQYMLGHKSLAMTMRYAHYIEDSGRDVIDQMDFGLQESNVNKMLTNDIQAGFDKKVKKPEINIEL
ncbi:tyrosine-type recombinase/integrase [bacterium]|nr:tyrosine-type recombinase/integrase [bacterium]